MIKDAEIAMVNAATFALDYQDKHYNADAAEIIKKFMSDSNHLKIKNDIQIYAISAINEIIKIKRDKAYKGKNNKQLMQIFMRISPELSRRIKEDY